MDQPWDKSQRAFASSLSALILEGIACLWFFFSGAFRSLTRVPMLNPWTFIVTAMVAIVLGIYGMINRRASQTTPYHPEWTLLFGFLSLILGVIIMLLGFVILNFIANLQSLCPSGDCSF